MAASAYRHDGPTICPMFLLNNRRFVFIYTDYGEGGRRQPCRIPDRYHDQLDVFVLVQFRRSFDPFGARNREDIQYIDRPVSYFLGRVDINSYGVSLFRRVQWIGAATFYDCCKYFFYQIYGFTHAGL